MIWGNSGQSIKWLSNLFSDIFKTNLWRKNLCIVLSVLSPYQVFDLDISKHLEAYKIEYHVLREEMLALKASAAAKINNPREEVLKKGGTEYSGSILPPTLSQDHHQDLMAKVQELTLVNEQLMQQVEVNKLKSI